MAQSQPASVTLPKGMVTPESDEVHKTGAQLGGDQESADAAYQAQHEGGKKGGEIRKSQMSSEDYAEMGRKGGKARASGAAEGAEFAGQPKGEGYSRPAGTDSKSEA